MEGGKQRPIPAAPYPRVQISPQLGTAPSTSQMLAPGASSAHYLVPALQGPFPLLEQIPLVPLRLCAWAAPRTRLLHHLPALGAL